MEQFIFAFNQLLVFLAGVATVVGIIAFVVIWACLLAVVIFGKKWRWYTKSVALLIHGYFVSLVGASVPVGYVETGLLGIIAAVGVLVFGVMANGIPWRKTSG